MTESTGKLCSACSEKKSKAQFSNKQWLEPAASRRCSPCIAANITKPPPAAPTPTPTPTAIPLPLKPKKPVVTRPTPVRENSVLSNKPHSARPPPKKNPKRPVLLEDDGDWFVEKAEAALGEIFDRFDGDKDGQWTIKDTQAFAMATNGKPFNTESHHNTTATLQRPQDDVGEERERSCHVRG